MVITTLNKKKDIVILVLVVIVVANMMGFLQLSQYQLMDH